MLLYSLLHLAGYELSMDELKNFRQWKSKTPGHPEAFLTPGVEATTGPLGQGTANAVGMAIAERRLAHLFNRPGHSIVDHHTYALVSDGDLMEGISAEAASLAGHLKLGKLIYLYDANDISLDGPTSLTFTESVADRYTSHGWQVLKVEDGDKDLKAIDKALEQAKADRERPSLIIVRTTIGFGSPNKAGTSASHGSPLGAEEVRKTKEALDWNPDHEFFVPEAVKKEYAAAAELGNKDFQAWQKGFEAYAKEHPELAEAWQRSVRGELPEDWDREIPSWPADSSLATRSAGGKIMNAIAKRVPLLIGGDADLSCSTKTLINEGGSFEGREGSGCNIHFGVREHAMGAIANGVAYHGQLRSFTATFFTFSDYMRPALRLAALNKLPVTFIFTHDSIGLGEDGPTHQAVEQLMSLRCMPGLRVIRPCDANETAIAWRTAMERSDGPTVLVLSRQNLPTLDRQKLASADQACKGAYTLCGDAKDAKALLLASGSEVPLALEAVEKLSAGRRAKPSGFHALLGTFRRAESGLQGRSVAAPNQGPGCHRSRGQPRLGTVHRRWGLYPRGRHLRGLSSCGDRL